MGDVSDLIDGYEKMTNEALEKIGLYKEAVEGKIKKFSESKSDSPEGRAAVAALQNELKKIDDSIATINDVLMRKTQGPINSFRNQKVGEQATSTPLSHAKLLYRRGFNEYSKVTSLIGEQKEIVRDQVVNAINESLPIVGAAKREAAKAMANASKIHAPMAKQAEAVAPSPPKTEIKVESPKPTATETKKPESKLKAKVAEAKTKSAPPDPGSGLGKSKSLSKSTDTPADTMASFAHLAAERIAAKEAKNAQAQKATLEEKKQTAPKLKGS